MGGAIGGGMTKSCSEVVYYLDEGLPNYVADWMKRVGLEFVAVQPSTPDNVLIRAIGELRHRGVWVTQDLRSRHEHRSLIMNQGISVAWIDCGNATRLKRAFLVVSFAYGIHRDRQDGAGYMLGAGAVLPLLD